MPIKNDGGSAFPVTQQREELQEGGYRTVTEQHAGMSLRDYFAAQALPALIDVESTADLGAGRCMFDHAVVAREAYELADALLEAREKAGDE